MTNGHLRCRAPLPAPTSAPPPIPGFRARTAASVTGPRSTFRAEDDDRSRMLPDGNIKKNLGERFFGDGDLFFGAGEGEAFWRGEGDSL